MAAQVEGGLVPVKHSGGLQRWLSPISVIIRAFDSRERAVYQIVKEGKLHIEHKKSKPEKGNLEKKKEECSHEKGNRRSKFSFFTRLATWLHLSKSNTKEVKKTKIDILARALYRMQLLTNSQMEVLLVTCGLIKEENDKEMGNMVERVMAWRDKRGDFDDVDGNEEDVEEPIILPLYMEEINDNFLHYCGLLKTDLQLECLLRNVQYSRHDTKPGLVSKLMEFKHKLSSASRGLELEDDAYGSPPVLPTNDM